MNDINPFKDKQIWLGICLMLIVILAWLTGILYLPTDQHQGEVYKIIFLHVPSAFAAFFSALALFLASIIYLLKKRSTVALWGKASAEVGLIFTLVTLATGSIWGKPTWGTWWTWDARLTTTFILALLYAGYLLAWSSISSYEMRYRVNSILGILIFADVPIIYKSVTWWRTLHQPPTLLREGGASMSTVMLSHLIACLILTLLIAVWFIWQRALNLILEQKVETLTLERLSTR